MNKFILIFIFFSISFGNITAQKKKVDVQKRADSILKIKPKTYKEINTILRVFRKDTTQLRLLVNIFSEKGYLVGKSYALNILGTQYRNYSDYKKAIKIHKKALETAIKANNIEFRVFSLNMLGVDYRKIDANRTALDYNQEALALAETVENPNLGLRRSIAVSHNSMGNIYLLLKQYDLASNQFYKSLKIEESINNELGIAINNQNIGYAKEALGDLDEALDYYKGSLSVNIKINNRFGIVICNSSIGRIYIKQGNSKKAIPLIKNNLLEAIKLENQDYLSTEYINLGWAQTKLYQYENAEKNLLKGLEIAKKYGFSSVISEAYAHLSELAQQKNDFENSLAYYKLAEEFDEKISNERNIQYVNDLIIKYDSEKKNNQIKVLAKQNEIDKLDFSKKRNIFLISLVSLVLLGLVLYFLYRHRYLKNEKRILTLEQDLLSIQMNPHFIFNALNSIKLYIINNEQKNAVHYLNKFSKLIRKILDASSVKETSLAEELETMDLYMGIENIRFSNQIKYETIIDSSIDLENIKVPPLVLQPFLENAIWHGLSSKKGLKKIIISVSQSNKEFIQIDIEDNGIGRIEAAKIKAKKVIHRKSIGIDLTKERLTNFAKDFQNSFSLTFNDLINDTNNSSGTKLTLQIPLF
ncbi:MAG: tetratricopeptide repeat protein [Flavobacteriaceae bacterium]|nr:tetratricopeptide repeat protein [Flavobacteriaceae bacterium]